MTGESLSELKIALRITHQGRTKRRFSCYFDMTIMGNQVHKVDSESIYGIKKKRLYEDIAQDICTLYCACLSD